MKFKRFFGTVLVLLAVGISSACSSGRAEFVVPDYFDTTTPVEVEFWHTMGAASEEILNRMIEDFNVIFPNITINHASQGNYDSLFDMIARAIPARAEPTMAYVYPDHVATYLGRNPERSAVVPLNDLIYHSNPQIGLSAADRADFIQVFWDEGAAYGVQRNGENVIFSMPFSKSTEVLFYNRTFFQTHNLTVPTTWEEARNVARQIRHIIDTDPSVPSNSLPFAYDSASNLFITSAAQQGNAFTSATPEHFLFDNPGNRAMVEFFADMYNEGIFVTRDMPELQGTFSSSMFTVGQAFMTIGSTGGTRHNIPMREGDGFIFDAGVAPLPQFDLNNRAAIQQGPSISFFKRDNSQEVVAAWLFYKFITNPTNSAIFAMSSGYEPVRYSSYELPIYQAFLEDDNLFTRVARVTQVQKDDFFFSPAFRGSAQARQQVGNIINQRMLNTRSADQAFSEALRNLRF